MKIGAILPNTGAVALELGVSEMARAAVNAGARGLWVSDHLVLHRQPTGDYPYSPDGRMTWDPQDDYLEALITCAYVAGALQGDCTIGTAVMVLPQRNVLQTAKEIATLDRLTGGRLCLGLGVGWNEVEMEALGYDYRTRGTRFDEMLTVLRDAWSGRTTGFSGAEVTVPADLVLSPTPTYAGGPPLLIGGMTRAAVKRAARAGDGWLALAFVDQWSRDDLAVAVQSFRTQWHQHGRRTAPQTVLKLHCTDRRVDELALRVAEAAALGFDEVIVELPWSRGIEEAAKILEGVLDDQR